MSVALKVYYKEENGEVLVFRTYYHCEPEPEEIAEDYAQYPELNNGEGVGRIFRQLTAQEMADGWRSLGVDISKQPPEIVFEGVGE